MQLIIDSGATKANWTLADQRIIQHQVYTQGIHPLLMSDETMRSIAEEAQKKGITSPASIFYYGTGCKVESSQIRIKKVLQQAFPNAANIEVATDLLGAARALCQHSAGIACILGTGSNSCYYDGENMVQNKGGFGFILGDEGSGAALGKDLMAAYLNEELSSAIKIALEKEYSLSPEALIEATYRQPAPSRYLAKFAAFMLKNQQDTLIHQIIQQQFELFIRRYILPYPQSGSLPIHFIGSIAWHFRPFIETILKKTGLRAGNFLNEPMEGLLNYHQ